jgi:hypothetical protein
MSPTTEGVDAFSHSWDGENFFACPPVNLVVKTIKKLGSCYGSGLLIVPNWRAQKYWTFIYPDGSNLNPIFSHIEEIKPKIIQNQRARSALAGIPSFTFSAIRFNRV